MTSRHAAPDGHTAQVFLGLGSNVGDRRHHLDHAVQRIREHVRGVRLSSVYETDPVGVENQPSFLNLVLAGSTELAPKELLAFVKEVERETGRVETYRWGPRVLDVDILLYDGMTVDEPALIIPHPRMLERRFVVAPLLELEPDIRMPNGEPVVEPGRMENLARQRIRRLLQRAP